MAGRLVRIEVENFKSYKGHQIIGPFDNFSCVIGPNGSGKSNLMDAVSFVLGVKAATLRGQSMKDLIYSSTGEKPSGKAVVTVVYAEGNENTPEYKETYFSRTVTAEGNTDYRFNSRVVTFENYSKKLAELGVVLKAKNCLVFQGDVEGIATRNPKELAQWIEHLSGSDEFKTEYEKLKLSKQEADDETYFAMQKKKGVAAEKKQYREQKVEADKYQSLMDKRADVQHSVRLWEAYHTVRKIENITDEKEALDAELETNEHQNEAAANRLDEVKTKQAKLEKETLKLKRKRSALKTKDSEKATEADKAAQALKRAEMDVKKAENMIAEKQAEIERRDADVASLEKKQKKANDVLKAFEAEHDDMSPIHLADAQLDEYRELKEKAIATAQKDQSALQKLGRAQKGDEAELSEVNAKEEDIKASIRSENEALEMLEIRQSKLERVGIETREQTKLKETELSEARSKHRNIEGKVESIQTDLNAIVEEIREIKSDKKAAEKERQIDENMKQLSEAVEGVHDRMVNICTPAHRRYGKAVEAALGKHCDSVVTSTRKSATDAVEYLRSHRLGRSRFLPVDFVEVPKQPATLPPNIPKNIPARLAINCVSFDEMHNRAVQFALNNTVICDDLASARIVAFESGERRRVVTLNGEIVEKSGLMSGGFSDGAGGRYAAKDTEALKKKRDRLFSELTQAQKEKRRGSKEANLKAELEGLKKRIKHNDLDVKTGLEKIKRMKANILNLEKELEGLPSLTAKLENTIADRLKVITVHERSLHNVEDRIFKSFCKQIKVNNIREYEEGGLKQAEARAQKRGQLTADLAQIEQKLSFEKDRELTSRKAQLEDQLKKAKKVVIASTATSEKLKAELERTKADLDKVKKALADLDTKTKDVTNEIEAIAAQVAKTDAAVAQLRKKITNKEGLLDQARAQRHDLFVRWRLEGGKGAQSLPEVSAGSGCSQAVESDSMGIYSQATSRVHDTEDCVTLDFSELESALKKDPSSEVRNRLQAEIQALTAQADRIAPNMRAGDRLIAVTDRFTEVGEEVDNARQAANSVAKRFREVEKERHERFMKCFQHLADTVNDVYKALTQSPSCPNGGTAYLSLDSSETPWSEGVRFSAMPPHKRFRDISDLSGGEKTVASLALLFSAHSFRPSPFYIMDEVDAALDPTNVQRVSRFLQQKSKETQMIVISLKETVYSNADGLVGVYRNVEEGGSKAITLSLRNFPTSV